MSPMRLRNRLSRRTAFAAALLGAPIAFGGAGAVFSILGGWLNVEPLQVAGMFLLFSVGFGGLSYLIVGGYFFWRAARWGARHVFDFVVAGFIANIVAGLISLLLGAIAYRVLDPGSDGGAWVAIPLIVHAFGLIFAPAYGLAFGWLFTRLADDFSPQAKPLEDVEAVFR